MAVIILLEAQMISNPQRIVRAIVWSLSGILLGWAIGQRIGILVFGGYYYSSVTVIGHAHVVYPGVAAILGAFLGWILGTALTAWPKTQSSRFHFECWTAILVVALLLGIFGLSIPPRE